MRILHVITDLDMGGAQMMLFKLFSAGDRGQSAVVSLKEEGIIGRRVSAMGIPVFSLRLSRGILDPFRALTVRSIIKKFRPSVIVGWMPHGNLVARLASALSPEPVPLIWNIRMSLYSVKNERRLTAAAIRVGALLSRKPVAIVYNSLTGAQQHEAIGYAAEKRIVIPNGFDCQTFKPDPMARDSVRAELGINSDALLVGLFGRYHPMKDHANFLEAAGAVGRRCPNVYFLIVGTDATSEQPELVKTVSTQQLQQRAFLLGERSDIPRLTAALDIACSASAWGEGFSNTLGEAMACGVPCVTTDIGDSCRIVADTGLCVASKNPQALAEAILRLLEAGQAERQRLGAAARLRIETEFSLPTISGQYEKLYENVMRSSRAAATY